MATPEQIEEYKKLWEEAVDKVFKLINANDWRKEKSKEEGLDIYLRSDSSSNFNHIKSVCIVNAPLSAVEDKLKKPTTTVDENTPDEKRGGDIEKRMLGTVGNDSDCAGFLYVVLKSPSKLVKPRDFLSFQKIANRDGKVALVRTSIKNEALQDEVKGYVRGNLYYQAYIAEEDGDNKTKLTFIGHADPGEGVPTIIYNEVAIEQGYNAFALKKEVEGAQ